MSHCQGCANWEKSFQEQGAAGLKMAEMIRDLKARNAALEADREAFAREVALHALYPSGQMLTIKERAARAIAAVKAARGE